MAAFMDGMLHDQMTGYSGPRTREMAEHAHVQYCKASAHMRAASAASPDAAHAVICDGWASAHCISCALHHSTLPDFNFEAICGKGGARLSNVVERYDYDLVHFVAKGFGFLSDNFMYGMECQALVLFVGDVAAVRAGAVKLMDAHKRVLARVRQGEAEAYEYVHRLRLERQPHSSAVA